MPLTIRYTGTWFRGDVVAVGLFGCVFAAALGLGMLVYWSDDHPIAVYSVILNALLWLIPAFLLAYATRALITVRRFRLQIDPSAIIYRRMFRESSYPRAQIGVLRWDPGIPFGRNSKPPYLLFKDHEGDLRFSILGSLLSTAQLKEISLALGKTILDLDD